MHEPDIVIIFPHVMCIWSSCICDLKAFFEALKIYFFYYYCYTEGYTFYQKQQKQYFFFIIYYYVYRLYYVWAIFLHIIEN